MSARVQTGANCEDFGRACPVVRELGLEGLGVRVRLRALADSGSHIVHPHPAANGEFGTGRSALEKAELRRSTR